MRGEEESYREEEGGLCLRCKSLGPSSFSIEEVS